MKILQAVLVLAVLGCAHTASAQNYPTRSMSIVVAFSAGGPTDTIARIMAERMTRALGQTMVVDNVTGAGGSNLLRAITHKAMQRTDLRTITKDS